MRPLLAAAALTLASAQAQAACLTEDDARALLSVALPDAIDALTTRCSATLPRDGFLPSEGAALAQRYRRETAVDPARARHAIEVASGQDLSFLASDDTVTKLAHDYVAKTIRDRVQPRDCATVDGLLALAAPMRPGAMVEAILIGLQLAGPDALPGGIALCSEERR